MLNHRACRTLMILTVALALCPRALGQADEDRMARAIAAEARARADAEQKAEGAKRAAIAAQQRAQGQAVADAPAPANLPPAEVARRTGIGQPTPSHVAIECIGLAQGVREVFGETPGNNRSLYQIYIMRSLQGIDDKDREIIVASDKPFAPARTCLVTYKRDPYQKWATVTAVEDPAPERIKAVEKQAADAGRKLLPPRVLWVYGMDRGGELNVLRSIEFHAAPDGRFTLTLTNLATRKAESIEGKITNEVFNTLVDAIESAPRETGGEVLATAFNWVNSKGEAQFRFFQNGPSEPAKGLTDRIIQTARQHTGPATQPAREGDAK